MCWIVGWQETMSIFVCIKKKSILNKANVSVQVRCGQKSEKVKISFAFRWLPVQGLLWVCVPTIHCGERSFGIPCTAKLKKSRYSCRDSGVLSVAMFHGGTSCHIRHSSILYLRQVQQHIAKKLCLLNEGTIRSQFKAVSKIAFEKIMLLIHVLVLVFNQVVNAFPFSSSGLQLERSEQLHASETPQFEVQMRAASESSQKS